MRDPLAELFLKSEGWSCAPGPGVEVPSEYLLLAVTGCCFYEQPNEYE